MKKSVLFRTMRGTMARYGKIVLKEGRPYWVEQGVETPSQSHTIPTENKMIPMSMLTREMKELLSDAYKYIHTEDFYKKTDFLNIYQDFHSLTGNKYLAMGFEKFKVACHMARKKGY